MEEQNSPILFNEWLKRRRKSLDLTQKELAERAGCSVGALRKIESGERRPSKQLAGLLADALEISGEDRQMFIRVARGELNVERLRHPSPNLPPSFLDVITQRLTPERKSHTTREGFDSLANRFPVQTTLLIGREAELDALERLFNDPQCRLLTLTGIGGIGKTRLAIEFASRNHTSFSGGVFYIPLTQVNSPEKIIPAIAEVFDYGFSGPSDPKEQLLNYLSNHIVQEALFIFDNLEHLLEQVPIQAENSSVVDLILEILRRLPNVKILGTSRERLNLQGEWAYELHGLSVPSTDFAGRLEDYDSIALFVKSAQRIRTDFQATDEDPLALVRISQLVEGVPLAIELAAAWVGILSCQEIAQEIKSNMDFLTTTMRDIPERHRSIRATFDHSWKLLSNEERGALRQLSVFQGGFDRSAAEMIAGASLPLLASLSAKSLVRRNESGRYDLHEVIRQYAASHLKASPRSFETCESHSEYYLGFVRDREESLKSSSQQEVILQLTDEIDNIRAAWSWAIDHEKFLQLGHAGRAFGWYFELSGLYREGIEQFEPLTHLLRIRFQENEWDWLLGLTLIQQALLYFRKGESGRARELYEESITILSPIGDTTLLADAHVFLGIILHLNGEYQRAKSLLEEGLVLARECNDVWFEAYAIYNLGYIASLLGRYSEGYGQMLEGLELWRKLGDPQYIALGLNFLVPTLNNLGLLEKARDFMRESIALCEKTKNRWGLGTAYRYLGLVSITEGKYAEAQNHLLRSLEIFGELVMGWHIAISLTFLGDATRLLGDHDKARDIYLESLRLSMEAKKVPVALDAITGLGYIQAHAGEVDQALVLCYFVLNHPASEDETKNRAEGLRSVLEQELKLEQVNAARTLAGERSFDEVVTMALEFPYG